MAAWNSCRFQRQVKAQPAEAGDEQLGLRAAHPVPHVHGREPHQRLGGGPAETAQVRLMELNLLMVFLVLKQGSGLFKRIDFLCLQ